MFIADVPDVPPQNVPVLIAQANQAQPSNVRAEHIVGVCQVIPNGAVLATPTTEFGLLPIFEAKEYLNSYEHRTVTELGAITILQQPKHGILRLLTEADRGTFFDRSAGPVNPTDPGHLYLPKKGYFGKDSATVLVDFGGLKVKVVYFFQTVDRGTVPEGLTEDLCKKGPLWKISSALDANVNSPITSVKYQSLTTSVAGTTSVDTLA